MVRFAMGPDVPNAECQALFDRWASSHQSRFTAFVAAAWEGGAPVDPLPPDLEKWAALTDWVGPQLVRQHGPVAADDAPVWYRAHADPSKTEWYEVKEWTPGSLRLLDMLVSYYAEALLAECPGASLTLGRWYGKFQTEGTNDLAVRGFAWQASLLSAVVIAEYRATGEPPLGRQGWPEAWYEGLRRDIEADHEEREEARQRRASRAGGDAALRWGSKQEIASWVDVAVEPHQPGEPWEVGIGFDDALFPLFDDEAVQDAFVAFLEQRYGGRAYRADREVYHLDLRTKPNLAALKRAALKEWLWPRLRATSPPGPQD